MLWGGVAVAIVKPTLDEGSMFASTIGGESAEGARPPVSLPRQVGRFVVLRQIGQGGMGVVYAAYDEELDRRVAVKLLRVSEPTSREQRLRVLREAQAMARVAHPNVVSVYEVGELDAQVFIAMEFVEGTTLGHWQHEAGRTWEDVIGAYLAAGDGLFAAHQAGLVHRDFKPENVLIGSDGRPRVADFGLARVGPGTEAPPASGSSGEASPHPALDTPLTIAGTILGTPSYMSPEQHRGTPADARSDQFSFCVALYEALYGTLPFAGETLAELSASVSSGVVRAVPATSPVPPPIEATLRRGLAADPAARFPSMAALLDALSVDPRHDRAAAPGARRLLLACLLLVLLGTTFLAIRADGGYPKQVTHMYQVGVVQFAAILGAALALRRRLRWNTFHWGILRAFLIGAGQMAVLRWITMRAGLDLRWIVALDVLAFGTGLATVSWSYIPRAWPAVGLCVGSAVAVTFSPRFMSVVTQMVYTLAMLFVLLLWHRSARSGAARTEPSRSALTTARGWTGRGQESQRRSSW